MPHISQGVLEPQCEAGPRRTKLGHRRHAFQRDPGCLAHSCPLLGCRRYSTMLLYLAGVPGAKLSAKTNLSSYANFLKDLVIVAGW